jgi:hypothetical protein
MTRTPALAQQPPACAVVEDRGSICAANDNTCAPTVLLTPIGNGMALARTLARVLVRRELILANAIPDSVHCNDERSAG